MSHTHTHTQWSNIIQNAQNVSGVQKIFPVKTGLWVLFIFFSHQHGSWPRTSSTRLSFRVRVRAGGARWRCGAADRISRERGNAAGPTGNLIRRRRLPVEFFRYVRRTSLRRPQPVAAVFSARTVDNDDAPTCVRVTITQHETIEPAHTRRIRKLLENTGRQRAGKRAETYAFGSVRAAVSAGCPLGPWPPYEKRIIITRHSRRRRNGARRVARARARPSTVAGDATGT